MSIGDLTVPCELVRWSGIYCNRQEDTGNPCLSSSSIHITGPYSNNELYVDVALVIEKKKAEGF